MGKVEAAVIRAEAIGAVGAICAVLGFAGGSAITAATRWPAASVSQSYKCGVLRALRNQDHMGPTSPEEEALCTTLQQADWSPEYRKIFRCLEAAGWGNYSRQDRSMEAQERCIAREKQP
jgi:hypothetical protein